MSLARRPCSPEVRPRRDSRWTPQSTGGDFEKVSSFSPPRPRDRCARTTMDGPDCNIPPDRGGHREGLDSSRNAATMSPRRAPPKLPMRRMIHSPLPAVPAAPVPTGLSPCRSPQLWMHKTAILWIVLLTYARHFQPPCVRRRPPSRVHRFPAPMAGQNMKQICPDVPRHPRKLILAQPYRGRTAGDFLSGALKGADAATDRPQSFG